MQKLTNTSQNETSWSLFIQGNNDALSSVYKALLPKLLLGAYRYLKDQEKSRDVVGEVFVALISMTPAERQEKLGNVTNKLEPFLNVIVKNKCLNIIKHEKVKQTVFSNLRVLITPVVWKDEAFYEDYKTLIELLPTQQKNIFLLHIEGYKNNEIAEQLNISINTVKNTLVNVKKKLRGLYNVFMK